MLPGFLWKIAAVAAGVLLLGAGGHSSGDGNPSRKARAAPAELNADSIHALLDLIDTIRNKHPDYRKHRIELEALKPEVRRKQLDQFAAANAADAEVVGAIDRFLNTEARVVYFRRYRNATSDHFRRAFLALPYEKIQAPGDLALPFYELVDSSEKVRADLTRFLAEVDLRSCEALARAWAPPGNQALPPVYLVYDLNAGSYTAEGKAFYNLYSGEGAEALAGGGQAVLAHELQHLFAAPYLRMARRRHLGWQLSRMEGVLMDLVSEGSALHCNPPRGFKREVFEDPSTVAALIDDLNRHFLRLLDGKIEEEDHWNWVRRSFHTRARELLEAFATRQAGNAEDAAALVHANLSHRPDLSHALGWWMVSRISREGQDSEAVHALIRDPYSLFARYNEAASEANPQVDPRIVSALVAD